ncbi:MAG: hypothetical protein L3K04_04615 [Thermoplasmata archaeon]|nr:hypothetical protein [Thermoplasmata archaeon]
MRYENVVGTPGGSPSSLVEKIGGRYSSACFVGFLHPGGGPTERELVLRRGDLANIEHRGRPGCAIYRRRENHEWAVKAYVRFNASTWVSDSGTASES